MNRLCRRSFTTLSLAWLAALAALGTGVSGLAQAQEEDKVLNIYNWSDYIAEADIDLGRAARTRKCSSQQHPHAAVAGFLADVLHAHR